MNSLPRNRPRSWRRALRSNLSERIILRVRCRGPDSGHSICGRVPTRPWHCPPRPQTRESSFQNTRGQCRPPDSRFRSFKNNGRRAISCSDHNLRNARLHGARDIQKDRPRQTSVSPISHPPFALPLTQSIQRCLGHRCHNILPPLRLPALRPRI